MQQQELFHPEPVRIGDYSIVFWRSPVDKVWWAIAKKTPFIHAPCYPLFEPGKTWFEPGHTAEAALANLKPTLD